MVPMAAGLSIMVEQPVVPLFALNQWQRYDSRCDKYLALLYIVRQMTLRIYLYSYWIIPVSRCQDSPKKIV